MNRDRLLKQLCRERFVVTLRTGEAFDGLLDRFDLSTLELVDVFAVSTDARVKVDGRVYLPREGISYMQRPEAK